MTKKSKSSSIILDLSIKNALAKRGQLNPKQDAILPWWFKRDTAVALSHERVEAFKWLMRWLNENAPVEAEHVYDESDGSQNIVINPMIILSQEVQAAFIEAGFRVMTEDDLPESEKSDIWERIAMGSNFNEDQKWH